MKISDKIMCAGFPCSDVDKDGFIVPPWEIDAAKIKLLLITPSPPPSSTDYFYAAGSPFYLQTTLQAFNEAGANVKSMRDIIGLGIYITTAIKCPKSNPTICVKTQKNCAALLENEVALFPNTKVFFLGGDAPIKMMNAIWKKTTGQIVIPAISTYKIRDRAFYLGGARVFPSYSPAGKQFLIEKPVRIMVTEDIRSALALI
jgi:uracil-DNA glycosylase